jgi:hypothetical protein
MVRLDVSPPAVDDDVVDDIVLLPTNLYSDEPPLETDFHRNQIDLLIRLLKYWWQDRPDFYQKFGSKTPSFQDGFILVMLT